MGQGQAEIQNKDDNQLPEKDTHTPGYAEAVKFFLKLRAQEAVDSFSANSIDVAMDAANRLVAMPQINDFRQKVAKDIGDGVICKINGDAAGEAAARKEWNVNCAKLNSVIFDQIKKDKEFRTILHKHPEMKNIINEDFGKEPLTQFEAARVDRFLFFITDILAHSELIDSGKPPKTVFHDAAQSAIQTVSMAAQKETGKESLLYPLYAPHLAETAMGNAIKSGKEIFPTQMVVDLADKLYADDAVKAQTLEWIKTQNSVVAERQIFKISTAAMGAAERNRLFAQEPPIVRDPKTLEDRYEAFGSALIDKLEHSPEMLKAVKAAHYGYGKALADPQSDDFKRNVEKELGKTLADILGAAYVVDPSSEPKKVMSDLLDEIKSAPQHLPPQPPGKSRVTKQ